MIVNWEQVAVLAQWLLLGAVLLLLPRVMRWLGRTLVHEDDDEDEWDTIRPRERSDE